MAQTPEEAARKVADSARRLPGEREAETSNYVDDAEHWAGVYSELIGFKEVILAQIEEQMENVSESGRHEVENDRVLMYGEMDRLRERFNFWTARAAQLGSGR